MAPQATPRPQCMYTPRLEVIRSHSRQSYLVQVSARRPLHRSSCPPHRAPIVSGVPRQRRPTPQRRTRSRSTSESNSRPAKRAISQASASTKAWETLALTSEAYGAARVRNSRKRRSPTRLLRVGNRSHSPRLSNTANTVYVASYFAPTGRYAFNYNYFATASFSNGPLVALKSGSSGSNGLFLYGASAAFPNASYQATNYWVDVVFKPSN